MMTTKMTKILGLGMAAMMTATGVAKAAEVNAYVDFASAYVFRGVTFNDGAVMQPGVDIVAPYGIEFGFWGNVDLESPGGRDYRGESEFDFVVSYALPVESFDLGIGYVSYLYPNAESETDREASLSAAKELSGVGMGLDLYYGFDGAVDKSIYLEGTLEYSIPLSDEIALDLGATAAFADIEGGESGFANYTFSIATAYKYLSASITYIGQGDDKVLPDDAYDVDVVGTIGIGTDF
jgi:uncharacterized protein (TIGR02001 family)